MGRKPVNKARVENSEFRQTLVRDLAQIYFANGFTRYTMDEISEMLGTSKATLYKHFASQEEMLGSIMQYKIREIEALERDLFNEDLDFSERYFAVIRKACQLLAEISIRFLSETRQKHPEVWERTRQFQDYALDAAEQFYRKGIEKGILNDMNPRVLALTDKMFIQFVSNQKLLEEYGVSLEEVFDGYFQMKSHGIFKS